MQWTKGSKLVAEATHNNRTYAVTKQRDGYWAFDLTGDKPKRLAKADTMDNAKRKLTRIINKQERDASNQWLERNKE